MSRSFVLLFFFVFSCGSIFADVDPRQGSVKNPSRRIFAPTGTMYLSQDGWQRCPSQVEGESNPFEGAMSLTQSICATSIDTFISELTAGTGGVQNTEGQKEQFCNRFVDELIRPGDENSCPVFNPSDEDIEEFKNACASNLHHIRAQHDRAIGASIERARQSHYESIIALTEEYRELSEKQNELIGELMSSQDGATAVAGLTCTPENRMDVLSCGGNATFNNYIGSNGSGCLLGNTDACLFFNPNDASFTASNAEANQRETMTEMARLVVPDFGEQELQNFIDEGRTAGEVYTAFQRHTIGKFIQIQAGGDPEASPENYQANTTLLYNSLGSRESTDALHERLQNPESEERQQCTADPCDSVVEYLANRLVFEGELAVSERIEKTQIIMQMMTGLEENQDQFQARYLAVQLIDRVRREASADVTEDELRSSGLLRHGYLEGMVNFKENDDISNVSQAFKNAMQFIQSNNRQARVDGVVATANPDGSITRSAQVPTQMSTFEIFKRFIEMERGVSENACTTFKEKVENLCEQIANNAPTLPPEETDQCLDFAFNSEYRDNLREQWRASNLTQDQMNGNYYSLVGMACIVAQESFTDNDSTQIANFRERMRGNDLDDVVGDDATQADNDVNLADKVRDTTYSDRERNAQGRGTGDDSLWPDMDEDPFGGATIRRSLRGDLASGGTVGGKLNSSDRRNGVGAAFAGLAKGNPDGVINGGVAGINGGVAGVNGGVTTTETRRNIEDSIDPSDPALAPYLQRIEELKASLAALESRLPAGEAGAQGEVAPSADMLALQAEIERERAELARLRADLEGQLANRNNGGSADPQGVDVNVATSFQGAGTTDPIAPPVDEAVEEADVAESYSSGITAPYGGGGGSGRSPASGGYDSALFLTETSDLLERYGAPIEVPYAEMQGRIMQTVNLDLLEEGEPVFKDLGNNQFLRYTLLENGEIEIKNVILPEGENPDLNDPVVVEEEVDDNPKTRYRTFKDL